MSREMLPPAARMRLTVEVLDLTNANTVGYRRPQDIVAFKSRKFALPVQSEDTLEAVWKAIEERYKKNYLDERQAASFIIKKLQDAYDCDLDLGDTVSSIFEGETDPAKRMIKVVPSFIDRDFSVPVTSNLRPGHAQKRSRGISEDPTSKRRRLERELPGIQEEADPLRNQPVPSTESEPSVVTGDKVQTNGVRSRSRTQRSHTGGSLVLVSGTQTGHSEFGPGVKQESPELGLPSAKPVATASSAGDDVPTLRASSTRDLLVPRRPTRSRSRTPRQLSTEIPMDVADDAPPAGNAAEEDVDPTANLARERTASVPVILQDSQEAEMHGSPKSSEVPSLHTPPPANTRRRDVYDVPSTPEFVARGSAKAKTRNKKTYGRSPRSANVVQKEVDLLNGTRSSTSRTPKGALAGPRSLTKKAHSFQVSFPDEIESTPQQEAREPNSIRAETEECADLTSLFLNTTAQDFLNPTGTPATPGVKRDRPKSRKKVDSSGPTATPPTKSREKRIINGLKFSPEASKQDKVETPSVRGNPSTKVNPAIQARLSALKMKQNKRQGSPKSAVPDSSVANVTSSQDSRSEGPISTTSANTSHLSAQPRVRVTPARSPVPLPENVQYLSQNRGMHPPGVGVNSTEVSRKPDYSTTASVVLPQGTPPQGTSHPGSNKTAQQAKSALSTQSGLSQDAPASAQAPKKRGRPKKTDLGEIHGTQVPKKRGRPRKTDSSDVNQSLDDAAGSLAGPINAISGSSGSDQAENAADNPDAIVISSREPTSSPDPSDSEPTQAEREPLQSKSKTMLTASKGKQNSLSLPDDQSGVESSLQSTFAEMEPTDNGSPMQGLEQTTTLLGGVETSNFALPEPEQRSETDAPGFSTPHTAGAQKEDWSFKHLERTAEPTVNGNTSRIQERQATSPPLPAEDGENSIQDPAERPNNDSESDGNSRSVSPAISTRSSPALVRQPARFLSHSPTPGGSISDEDSDESSAAPSQAARSPEIQTKSDTESDSSSESDSPETEDEDEQTQNTPDAIVPQSTADCPKKIIPSSPPQMHLVPGSTPIVPETSQSSLSQVPRKTPVPLPTKAQPRSSQSVSELAAQRPNMRRPHSFTPLREQLAQAKAATPATHKKPFDARNLDLGKLAAKGRATQKLALPNDDSSDDDDDESSESSDSD